MNEEQEIKKGEEWADILMLRKDANNKGRYKTSWGSKTALGIFKTICRLVNEQNQ